MHSLAFSADDKYVMTGDNFGIGFSDFSGGDISSVGSLLHTSVIRSLAFNTEGSRLATASEDQRIGYCFDPYDCKNLLFLKGHGTSVNAFAFSPDDSWLASGGEDGNVLLWDGHFPYVAPSLVRPEVEGRRWSAKSLAFSPDSQTLVSASWDGAIHFWDVETKQEKASWPLYQGTYAQIALSANGQWLALAADRGPHRVWK
jgi:WD40 repeat protein